MKLTFHGAAREVGRSCIEIETKGEPTLLDCGVKFCREGFEYPDKLFSHHKNMAVLLSHAHLDHSGGLPFFEHYRDACSLFCTHQTLAITKILLKDSYKIAHIKNLHPAWTKTDITDVQKHAKRIQFDKWYKHGELKFRYINAGHIPGSAMILLETEGKRILYTGDFNTRTTRLMQPADFSAVAKFGKIDLLITECTYGCRELPPRKKVEKEFIAAVKRVVKRGGSVLIPVFALGRAQEIMIMLGDEKWDVPIYFDGMAKEITRNVINSQSTYVINKDLLSTMYFDRCELIASRDNRTRIASSGSPAIFVTTSGMMQGGPAIDYLKHLWHDKKNAVFLTGYQVHGTNGYRLLNEGVVPINGWSTPIKCEVRKFDFSGHADIEDIKKAILQLKPRKIVFQHGNEESVESMLVWAKQNALPAVGPKIGDVLTL